MSAVIDIFAWQQVPERVSQLLPEAAKVRALHEKAALAADILPLTMATWNPEVNALLLYSKTGLGKRAYETYEKAIYDGSRSFAALVGAEPNWDEEILVKRGSSALIPGYDKLWNYSNAALGGPNPMTNGIVSALVLGGLGYGGGALAERLFPERYLERGKLRKSLATAGALGGLGFGAANAYANSRAMNKSYLEGLFTNNHTIPPYLQEKASVDLGPSPLTSMDSGLYAPSIPVPQFNRAAWMDVNKGLYNPGGMHTPPAYAAVTTGMMSGISAGTGSQVIRPVDVVKGFMSAGVGLATANIAGKTLSALAGLTPEAQNKLQDMGLWAGMMHAVVPPLFGRR
jgi:hypothetical protein